MFGIYVCGLTNNAPRPAAKANGNVVAGGELDQPLVLGVVAGPPFSIVVTPIFRGPCWTKERARR